MYLPVLVVGGGGGGGGGGGVDRKVNPKHSPPIKCRFCIHSFVYLNGSGLRVWNYYFSLLSFGSNNWIFPFYLF